MYRDGADPTIAAAMRPFPGNIGDESADLLPHANNTGASDSEKIKISCNAEHDTVLNCLNFGI